MTRCRRWRSRLALPRSRVVAARSPGSRRAAARDAQRALAARARRSRASAAARSGPGFLPVALLARRRRSPASAASVWLPACIAVLSPCRSSTTCAACARACDSPCMRCAARGARSPWRCDRRARRRRGRRSLAIVALALRRVVGEPLQLHGRQRRPRRARWRSCGFARVRRRRRAWRARRRARSSRSPPRRCRSSPSTGRRRAMFLGDVGAVPLGLPRRGVRHRAASPAARWPAWFPLLVFLPFVADATVTLARRALARRARLGGAPRRTTTSACTSWAPATRERSRVYGALMAGTARHGARVPACSRRAWGGPALGAWCVVMRALFARD